MDIRDFADAYLAYKNIIEAEEVSGHKLRQDYPSAGFYVYALVDPRDWTIFYVGKGIGGRVLKHEERTRRGVIENRKKVRRIQDIYAAGLDVARRVLFVSDSEETTLAVEEYLIDALRNCGLTNILGNSAVRSARLRKIADGIRERLENFRQGFSLE